MESTPLTAAMNEIAEIAGRDLHDFMHRKIAMTRVRQIPLRISSAL